ncbi:MAG: glycerol-3-phosphate dehydrogenase/oxidase [Crocinitomicaceae bacterium]|nr:glycerol-3-phosphate dehydrogenase/oxidase [Crocinitomicaceae bacterium]
MNRNKNIRLLEEQEKWDLVVIGGGATGLGAALDAVTRGMKVLLIEKHDFSKGTSSKSTKLIHGGVRYLKNLEFRLVKKALKERYILKKNAPHLVRSINFIIPVYSWFHFLIYGIGLKFYDLISGKWSFGGTRLLGREKTIAHLKTLKNTGLKGGVQYKDGQFDDARFAISLAHTIDKEGGTLLNHFEFLSLKKTNKKTTHITGFDRIKEEEHLVISRYLINATGVFSNNFMISISDQFKIRASRGTHIVLDRSFLKSESAIMIPKTNDGRVLFVIPWHQQTLIGTTDEESVNLNIDQIVPQEDLNFILNNVKNYLTKQPQKADIKSMFTGLRPLVSKNKTSSTSQLSRDHTLHRSQDGVLHVLGGKWTTYRLMGQEAMNYLLKDEKTNFRSSKTETLKLFGFKEHADFNDPLHVYGSEREKLRNFGSLESFSEKFFICEALIVYAINIEMAMTLEDILARRTRCLFIDATETLKIAPEVAQIMATVLKMDDKWTANQLDLFIPLASKYII